MSVFEKVRSFLAQRSRDYKLTFVSNISGQAVLADLAHFCRANESCFNKDARLHAVAEGRREVWLRIQDHCHLTPDQLYVLYNGGNFIPEPEEQS